jgi:hypothetical protein
MKITDVPPTQTRNIKMFGFTIRTNVRELPLAALVAKWRQARHPRTQASLINWINHYAGSGYRAAVPINELPRGHYRKVKAINNTQLSQLNAELTGVPIELPDRALVFGSAFHCRILEPELFQMKDYCLRPSEIEIMNKMTESFLSHPVASHIKREENEVPIYWTDEETGLPCKALVDNLKPQGIVCDLKTTFAANETEFRQHCIKYHYDRQLVGYTNGATQYLNKSSSKIEVLGIQKRHPYCVFCYQIDNQSSFFQSGQEKYRNLLTTWKATNRPISR